MGWKRWRTALRSFFSGRSVEQQYQPDELLQALKQVNAELKQLVQNQSSDIWPKDDYYFGIPDNPADRVADLNAIPNHVTGIHFYLGSEAGELIQNFIDSKYAQQVERLFIGNSSYNLGKGSDYSEIVRMLERGHFPRLRVLELGVWQLYSNSHCLFGTLGDISPLLSRLSQLETIGIFGHFDLSQPVSMANLKKLYIQVDDPVTGITGGLVTQTTVTHLFASVFPELEDAYIDLVNSDITEPYDIPDLFRGGENVPKLSRLELNGPFTQAVKHDFDASELGQRACSVAYIYLPGESGT